MIQLQIQLYNIDTVHPLKFVMSVCACACVLVGNYKSSISDSRAFVVGTGIPICWNIYCLIGSRDLFRSD